MNDEDMHVWLEETHDPDGPEELRGADSGTISVTETAHILVLEDVSEHPLIGHGYEEE